MNIFFKTNLLLGIAIIVEVICFAFNVNRLPPQIPIFYSSLVGDEQIGDFYMIFLLPLLSIIFVNLNNYIFFKYFRDNVFVERLIYVQNIAITLIFTFIFLRIIFLVV